MTLTPGLFSGGASGLFSGRAERPAGTTVFDSDFLLITVAFDCADNGLAGTLLDSTGAAGAVESIRELDFAGALPEGLFDGFSGAGAVLALAAFSVALPATAFLAGVEAGALAVPGRTVVAAVVFFTVEGIGVFAGFFIAFAMESTIN